MKSFSLTKAVSIIVIGGVLAGGAVAVRYARARVHGPASWRSIDQPIRDTTAEEYAVYSAIIDQVHFEDRLRVFVLTDNTAPCVRMGEWCTDKQIRNRFPNLQPETLDDYLTQNRGPAELSNSFRIERPAVMLSDRDLPEFLIKTNLKVNFSPLPARKIQWGEFYSHYPLSPGVISFSRLGFDSQIQQVLVYEEIAGNTDGSWGRYFVLTKESGSWVIQDKIESYFPEDPPPSVKHGEWGTLKGHVLDARAESLHEVELDVLSCGWDIGSLRAALGRDTIVLAEVSGKETLANEYGLTTWYRFSCSSTSSLPKGWQCVPEPTH